MLGLTLEGGGARGSYQIGAWKAFKEVGIEFGGITGTSVGALTGALMVQGDFELAYDLWYNMEPTRVLNIDDRLYEILVDDKIDSKEINIIYKQLIKVVKGFSLDTKPLQSLVNCCLKEDLIRSSKKDFGFVTVCLSELKPLQLYKEDVPYGKMGDYLLASSCLPIFKSRKYDGKNFIDGGFYNNLPIDMLYNKGYREVVAIRLNSQGRIKKNNYRDLKISYIQTHHDLGKVLEFTRERARRNLKLGYFDTLRHLKGLKGKEYYIDGEISEDNAFKYFMSLNESTIKKLADLFNLPQYMSLDRALLEGIIPNIFQLLNLDEKAGYKDLAFGIIERMALRKKINTFEIYSIDKLIEIIESKNFGYEKTKRLTINKKELFTSRNMILKKAVDIILEGDPNIQI